jgi:hypothetical protein
MRLFVLALLLFISSPAQSQQPNQTPNIQTKKNTEGGLKGEQKSKTQKDTGNPATAGKPQVSPLIGEEKAKRDSSESHEEGTEFWPPFAGYRLKITDTLLALFTFGLFVATWLLHRSTKSLVVGAEQTAERQLRAYVFVDASEIRKFGFDQPPEGWLRIKNGGATPAYDLERTGQIMLAPYPTKNFATLEWGGPRQFWARTTMSFLGRSHSRRRSPRNKRPLSSWVSPRYICGAKFDTETHSKKRGLLNSAFSIEGAERANTTPFQQSKTLKETRQIKTAPACRRREYRLEDHAVK